MSVPTMAGPTTPPRRYDPARIRPSASSPSSPSSKVRFSFPRPRIRTRPSVLDELLPLPSSYDFTPAAIPFPLLRRIGSVAVLSIFLLSIIYLALSQEQKADGSGLRSVFGYGNQADLEDAGWIGQELDEGGQEGSAAGNGEDLMPDFEQYTMLRTLTAGDVDVNTIGRRTILIGDVHGSLDPLQRLMQKLDYDDATDHLIHVGDLVAKGSNNNQVLNWMSARNIQGVRGNHDQPVIQWRSWMEWAGGPRWEVVVDSFATGNEAPIDALTTSKKMYPTDWEWKGEHWRIARNISPKNYKYLLGLPLVLHLPSLHAMVVHAGLLPHDTQKSFSDPTQPLVAAASSANLGPAASRASEESHLLGSPQNQDPWTLINMRSVFESGKLKGEVTKSSKKGTPWSEIWNEEMGRCTGYGSGVVIDDGNQEVEDVDVEEQEDGEVDEVEHETRREGAKRRSGDLPEIACSPVTVIYGHAAGRGLDIKPFSKGIDTGCVYGRQLTALVLGDTSGLEGEAVEVGAYKGLLVSVECGKGGV